jgi:(4S)-4-hydroxy-5-phosphonooxypentane-2,3-dione isomerase
MVNADDWNYTYCFNREYVYKFQEFRFAQSSNCRVGHGDLRHGARNSYLGYPRKVKLVLSSLCDYWIYLRVKLPIEFDVEEVLEFHMSKIYLFVDIDVKDGQRTGFLEKLKKHANHVRTEPGCEKLDVFLDTQRSDRVYVQEIWSSMSDFEAHMKCDTSLAWRPVAAPFIHGEKITIMSLA